MFLVCVALMNVACDRGAPATQLPSQPAHASPSPAPAAARPGLFEDITTKSGLDFKHEAGGASYFMPWSVGSGAAIFDFDGDGRLDIYLLQNAGPQSKSTNRLFRHTADFTFTDVTDGSGLGISGWGMGAAAADVDNDGKVDLAITEYGKLRLLLNKSEGTSPRFVDASAAAGVFSVFWGTSLAFVDYDRDGWLDLVAVNYLSYDPARWCAGNDSRQEFCGPKSFAGRPTQLFRNLGRSADGTVRFQDVTASSGLMNAPAPGLGVFCADFDGDRWPDIFVANDGHPNHLWINQKNGTFKEEGAIRGIALNNMGKAEANMGVGIGDANNDGLFDVFVTHLSTEFHRLWVQQPRGNFTDRTASSGLITSAWKGTGFGTVMADFDNNGGIDIAIANGRVLRLEAPPPAPHLDPFWVPYAERNQIFLSDGKGKFRDASPENESFNGLPWVSRGLATADFDNDGGLDLLVTKIACPATLFRNTAPGRGHFLNVQAFDPTRNRDAYGAEVQVRAGGRQFLRWVNPGYSYLCSNDPRVHFGLGDAEQYDEIKVIWPDGSVEIFPGGAADRAIVVRQGEGKSVLE